MPHIESKYLDEIQTNIRLRPIPWEGYVRANILVSEEAGLMKAIEHQSHAKRIEGVAADSPTYADAVISLLSKVGRDDVIKYVLSLTGDSADEVPAFRDALLSPARRENTYRVLTDLIINKNDEQMYLLGVKVLVSLLVADPLTESAAGHVLPVFGFLSSTLIASSNPNLQDIGVQTVQALLQINAFRPPFWTRQGDFVPRLVDVLRASSSKLQLQYYTLLSFWLLSFGAAPARGLVESYDLVPLLLDIAKTSVKEKIVRVAVATLVNCVNGSPSATIAALLSNGALPLVSTLSDRKWVDEELVEDLKTLKTRLQEAFDSMSTFDEYQNEVRSRKLQWSPPHKSELFWKDNADRFKDANWKVLKGLADIVSTSQDQVCLAVACSDLTNIINLLPESTAVLEKEGSKVKVMELMNHSNSDVRYEALKATQAFIAHSFK